MNVELRARMNSLRLLLAVSCFPFLGLAGESVSSSGKWVMSSGKSVTAKAPITPKFPLEEPGPDYFIQANNPLAEVTAFGLENYYLTDFEDFSDDANQFLIRFATPFSLGNSRWLFRSRLPVNHFPNSVGGNETGLGDLSFAFSYLFETADPNVSFGFGPTFRFPTATDDSAILGTEKWSAGLSNAYFNGTNEKLQFGYVLSWQQSFFGGGGREHFHVGALQPFVFYQLGGGWYTGTAPTWVYNFENDAYNFPIGLRLGRVFECNNGAYCNAWVEPQVAMFDRGPALPDWQIWAGLNVQFW